MHASRFYFWIFLSRPRISNYFLPRKRGFAFYLPTFHFRVFFLPLLAVQKSGFFCFPFQPHLFLAIKAHVLKKKFSLHVSLFASYISNRTKIQVRSRVFRPLISNSLTLSSKYPLPSFHNSDCNGTLQCTVAHHASVISACTVQRQLTRFGYSDYSCPDQATVRLCKNVARSHLTRFGSPTL